MRLIVTFLLSVASNAAQASTESLMRAKSALELELAIMDSSESARLTRECRAELSGSDLPRSCFILMRVRKTPPPEWLTRVCEKRARGAARVETLRDLGDLPERCRAIASERLLDLEYRIEDEEPIRLFDEVRETDRRSGS